MKGMDGRYRMPRPLGAAVMFAPRTPDRMRKRAVLWALLDQAFSSGTNFLLVLLAARTLGPAGLGTVTIGFAATLLYLLIVQRALVTDAITVKTSAAPTDVRRASTRSGLTVLLVAGVAFTAAMFAVSTVAPGPFGVALGAFAPWIAAVSVQDYWRYTLFREDRGLAASVNDAIWLAAMALATLAFWPLRSPAEVVSVWGVGATAGAITGLLQTWVRPGPLLASLARGGREIWPLARWFGAERLAAGIATKGATLIVAALVGTSERGGLRAVESLFAPLTLLIPAMSLPGLPAVTRAMSSSRGEGRGLALRLSALVVGIAGGYFAVLLAIWAVDGNVLGAVFGMSFERFAGLIAPIALS